MTERFKDEEKIESFEFRFSPSEQEGESPAITLLFTEEENSKLAQGWFVKPLSSPCRVSVATIYSLYSVIIIFYLIYPCTLIAITLNRYLVKVLMLFVLKS